MQRSSVLRIGQPKTVWNKRQKEFNQLSEKIEQLDKLIPELRTTYHLLIDRVQREYNPIVLEYQSFRVELVKLMDRTYEKDLYRKAYLTKLAYLISEISFDLIVNYKFEELIPLFNKYSEVDFEAALNELKRADSQLIDSKLLAEENEITEEETYPEHFHELSEEEQIRIKEELRAEKAKAFAEQAKEARQLLTKQKTTKSVRTVYMDLVKAFHPDRETDEAEKIRKTEIMQRVTQTYQENNLLELLKLQIEFERIDQDHLENLGKEQLTYYNLVLKEQVEELEKEKEEIQQQISYLCGINPQHANSMTTVVVKFNTNINEVKAEIKEIKLTLKKWQVPSVLKAFLKTYEIPNTAVFDDEDDD
ncbi:hypothetical protein ACFP1I_04395 [Dyadobacter subterraneus]|uniref:J domain-containing protein n=1 Tax=Dyadobacter subterraneus TaxID=2773304 RepID=A0ABR9WKE7_9BACT|nr:hypothetical protein [Dyadobacter subterraneus]MBE9464629.1 hypothetical protein [Dyadobacter subterraneus]